MEISELLERALQNTPEIVVVTKDRQRRVILPGEFDRDPRKNFAQIVRKELLFKGRGTRKDPYRHVKTLASSRRSAFFRLITLWCVCRPEEGRRGKVYAHDGNYRVELTRTGIRASNGAFTLLQVGRK